MHPHNRNDGIKARQLTNPADGAECHGQEWPEAEVYDFVSDFGLEQRYDASKSRLAR